MVRSVRLQARADVSFMNGAVEALPFTGGRFDAVLSTLMLHHLARSVTLLSSDS